MTALEASQVDAETKSAGRGVPSRTPAGPLLRLDQVQAATVVEQPFRHIVGVNVVDAGQASAIDRDFPDIRKSGFFVTEDLEDCGPAMQALLDEIAAPEFSRIVGEKLGLDLVGRPQMAAGALRYLEGPDVDGPGTEAIPPVFGVLTAFARSDTSWHGHPTFVGERRVIQLFWMVDEAAAGRKKRRHKRQSFWRFLRPALKENAVTG